jgi:predicted ATPase/DNA-binding SARP family transcriptional activator
MGVELRLLGDPRIFDGADWIVAPRDMRFALLAYLACAGDWVARERLAFLFWPDVDDAHAKRDLRFLLYRTKALGFCADLETQAGRVRWRVDTDVHQFVRAVQQKAWSEAGALHAGEFLEGFQFHWSQELEAWLELERGRLGTLGREARLARAAELTNTHAFTEAAAILATVVAEDSLDEEALQALARATYLGGRREEASRLLERFAARLLTELGLEPLPATIELMRQLRSGAVPQTGVERPPTVAPLDPVPVPRVVLGGIPPEITPFIGREDEVRACLSTLLSKECRLLTLVGPGGIGKTRLSMQVAAELAASFRDGLAFAPLVTVAATDVLASAIGGAVGTPPLGASDPELHLHAHMRDKNMLLLLDNAEHLLDAGAVVARLLEACPGLTVLATSRERLHVRGEWVVQVTGLTVPGGRLAPRIEGVDAVQLFVRRARQARTDFMLNAGNEADVVRICRLVGGAPLGIELAAALLAVLECRAVADAMEADLDVLTGSLRDLPERHHGLRAAFDQSWRLLNPQEREALRKVAVFRGGFTPGAAEHVAGVSFRSLLALLEKSLLQRLEGGRFDLHELVRQYAEEKLKELPTEGASVRDRHCVFFLAFVQERERELVGGDRQQRYLQDIDEDLDNVRSAWRGALSSGHVEAIEGAQEAMSFYYYYRGSYREGHDAMRLAAEATPRGTIHARLLAKQGVFAWSLFRLDEAQELSSRSLGILASLGEPPDCFALINLACVASLRGELEVAERWNEELLAAARQAGAERIQAQALSNSGNIASLRGRHRDAIPPLQQSLALYHRVGDRLGAAAALGNLAYAYRGLGELMAASAHYEESLSYGEALRAPVLTAHHLAGLAATLLDLERPERAEGHFHASIDMFRTVGIEGPPTQPTEPHVFWALLGLARALQAQRRHEEALMRFREALHEARTALAFDHALAVAGEIATLLELDGRDLPAAVLLAFVTQRAEGVSERERAQLRLVAITDRLDHDDAAAVHERATRLDFEGIDGVVFTPRGPGISRDAPS